LRINLKDLSKYTVDNRLQLDYLIETGVVAPGTHVKILGEGTPTDGVQIQAHFVSAGARAKIEERGGTIEIIKS
jgi:ribosomal protein L15